MGANFREIGTDTPRNDSNFSREHAPEDGGSNTCLWRKYFILENIYTYLLLFQHFFLLVI